MSAESPRHVRSTGGGPLTVPSQPPPDHSLIDAVSGFINDVKLTSAAVDPKDVIQWARFETADINEPTPEGDSDNDISPLLLILGYGTGVQVWLIPPAGEAQEVLSWRQGSVRVLRILPMPLRGDCFASKRPLIALCDSASPGPAFCSLSFISIRGGEQVKSIKFKNPILDVLANKRSVVVSFSERFAIFDAATLEDRMAVTTCYPCPCPLGGSTPINPLALGDRWLAYADKKLNPSKRSSGGCEGEGQSSYTATVLHAAKSLSKGLRGLGESVAQSLAGTRAASQSPSPPHADTLQPGIVTILDIEGIDEEDGQDAEEQCDPIVAHFTAHSEAIIALKFDASGMVLVTADRRGHDFHVFRINPHPCGPALASVHHLYILHRGDTTAKVQDIAISGDCRWAAVSTLRGTTHVFALCGYGGPAGVRTHTAPRVVNRLSRFHRSAGLPIHAASAKRGASNTPPAPVGESLGSGSWFPNPRLPPYPWPTVCSALAQLRATANRAHTITRTSAGRQRLSSLSEDNNSAPLLARAAWGTTVGGSKGSQHALYLMAASGSLMHLILHPRPASNVPKEKICDESPIELEVEQIAQWPLQRPAVAADLLAPLPPSNPLLQPLECRRCADICTSEEERWLAQVEIVTHAGPHRRLWMGPQFVFKTYNSTGSNSSLSEAETVEVEGRGAARSNPVNMPSVRPIVPVLIDSGSASSLEHSPSDSFRRKSLLAETGRAASVCDVQLREDLAEAMKEDHGCRRSETAAEGAAEGAAGSHGVELAVDPGGTVVRAQPGAAPPPPDSDDYTRANSDEATFRPVVRAPASLPHELPASPLPRTTTIPVQSLATDTANQLSTSHDYYAADARLQMEMDDARQEIPVTRYPPSRIDSDINVKVTSVPETVIETSRVIAESLLNKVVKNKCDKETESAPAKVEITPTLTVETTSASIEILEQKSTKTEMAFDKVSDKPEMPSKDSETDASQRRKVDDIKPVKDKRDSKKSSKGNSESRSSTKKEIDEKKDFSEIKQSLLEKDTADQKNEAESKEVVPSESLSSNKENKSESKTLSKEINTESKLSAKEPKSESKSFSKELKSEPKSCSKELKSESKSSSREMKSESKSFSKELKSESTSFSKELKSEPKSSSKELKSESKSSSREMKSESKSSSREMKSELKMATSDIKVETTTTTQKKDPETLKSSETTTNTKSMSKKDWKDSKKSTKEIPFESKAAATKESTETSSPKKEIITETKTYSDELSSTKLSSKKDLPEISVTAKKETITDPKLTTAFPKLKTYSRESVDRESSPRNELKETKSAWTKDSTKLNWSTKSEPVQSMLSSQKEVETSKSLRLEEVQIKTEEQAWDMLLNEPEKQVLSISPQSVSSDKSDETKPKSKKNRKIKKTQDDPQNKSEDDSFVEIHAIEEKAQPSSGDLVSISLPFEEIESACSFSLKNKKSRSPKNTADKEHSQPKLDDWSLEAIELKSSSKKKSATSDIESVFECEPKIKSKESKIERVEYIRVEGSNTAEIESITLTESSKDKKAKHVTSSQENKKSIDKSLDVDVKDVYVIDSTKDEFPEIQITTSRGSKSRKKSPLVDKKNEDIEVIPEKPIKSWSSIAASKNTKKPEDDAEKKANSKTILRNSIEDTECEVKAISKIEKKQNVSKYQEEEEPLSLHEELMRLCKRTDIMVAQCDAPSGLNFVEEHHSLLQDLPPLDLDFGLDDFKLEVMRDSLLDVNDTKLSSPICKIDIDSILSSIKESTSAFNLIDLEKVPDKKEKGFSVVENDKIRSLEVKADDDSKSEDKEIEVMEKSSDDDNTSPALSTDSDKEEKKTTGASNVTLPSSKQSSKSKKSRRKKK